MNTRAGESRSHAVAAAVPLLDRVLFLVLVAVLAARPLISESFQRVALSFLPADAPTGTTPATTVWLDSILLIAVALVWIRRWQPRPRVGVVSIALVVLLAAVVVSVAAANDKRLAANAGAHLFVMVLAATALVRVMRTHWMIHLLIAAMLASGATNGCKCLTQRAYEFDESLEYWQEQKPALSERGVDLNSPAVVNYERRLRSGEAFGYLSHPNVTASCLTMCLLVAVGLFIGVLRKPGVDANRRTATALAAAALGLALVLGLWLTGSLGAAAAGILAGLVLATLGLASGWISRHTRGAFTLLVVGYLAIIVPGATYGLWSGTLPHPSLAFRWQYWQAAAQTLKDTPLTGVGRENFRAAYMLYKSPESTEEVGNPHNLWLSLLVELGPLGLIAGVLLIGTVVQAAVGACNHTGRGPPRRAGAGVLIAAVAGVLFVQAVFSGEQFGAPGIPLLWAILVAAVWTLAFLLAYSLVSQVDEHPEASAWLVAGVGAALCAALIHNLIGFSFFTPAGLSVFAGLAAGVHALGDRPTARETEPKANGADSTAGIMPAVGLSVLLMAAYLWAVAAPTVRSEAARKRIEAELRAAPNYAGIDVALKRGLDTLAIDRWDARTACWLARTALQFSRRSDAPDDLRRSWHDLAERYASAAWRRNRFSFTTCQLRAEFWEARATSDGDSDSLAVAAREWEITVALYPTEPRTRISAGTVWFRLWRDTGSADAARNAAEHLEAARGIDATRLPEVAVKLRPAELKIIRERLDELRAAGFGKSTTSAPTRGP